MCWVKDTTFPSRSPSSSLHTAILAGDLPHLRSNLPVTTATTPLIASLLLTATRTSHLPIISFLLSHTPTFPLWDHKTILLHALDDPAVFKLFVERDAGLARVDLGECGTPLMAAVAADDAEWVTWLLERGAEPEVGVVAGRGCLGVAVERAGLEVVRLLVEAGARVGEDVVDRAKARGKEPVWRVLVEARERQKGEGDREGKRRRVIEMSPSEDEVDEVLTPESGPKVEGMGKAGGDAWRETILREFGVA